MMKINELFESEYSSVDSLYFYHVTNTERAYDIADSGILRPHFPWDYTDQEAWPDGGTEPRIYFSHNKPMMDFAPEEGHPEILRVRSVPMHKESTGDYYSTKPVKASSIEIKIDDDWIPLTNLL